MKEASGKQCGQRRLRSENSNPWPFGIHMNSEFRMKQLFQSENAAPSTGGVLSLEYIESIYIYIYTYRIYIYNNIYTVYIYILIYYHMYII